MERGEAHVVVSHIHHHQGKKGDLQREGRLIKEMESKRLTATQTSHQEASEDEEHHLGEPEVLLLLGGLLLLHLVEVALLLSIATSGAIENTLVLFRALEEVDNRYLLGLTCCASARSSCSS